MSLQRQHSPPLATLVGHLQATSNSGELISIAPKFLNLFKNVDELLDQEGIRDLIRLFEGSPQANCLRFEPLSFKHLVEIVFHLPASALQDKLLHLLMVGARIQKDEAEGAKRLERLGYKNINLASLRSRRHEISLTLIPKLLSLLVRELSDPRLRRTAAQFIFYLIRGDEQSKRVIYDGDDDICRTLGLVVDTERDYPLRIVVADLIRELLVGRFDIQTFWPAETPNKLITNFPLHKFGNSRWVGDIMEFLRQMDCARSFRDDERSHVYRLEAFDAGGLSFRDKDCHILIVVSHEMTFIIPGDGEKPLQMIEAPLLIGMVAQLERDPGGDAVSDRKVEAWITLKYPKHTGYQITQGTKGAVQELRLLLQNQKSMDNFSNSIQSKLSLVLQRKRNLGAVVKTAEPRAQADTLSLRVSQSAFVDVSRDTDVTDEDSDTQNLPVSAGEGSRSSEVMAGGIFKAEIDMTIPRRAAADSSGLRTGDLFPAVTIASLTWNGLEGILDARSSDVAENAEVKLPKGQLNFDEPYREASLLPRPTPPEPSHAPQHHHNDIESAKGHSSDHRSADLEELAGTAYMASARKAQPGTYTPAQPTNDKDSVQKSKLPRTESQLSLALPQNSKPQCEVPSNDKPYSVQPGEKHVTATMAEEEQKSPQQAKDNSRRLKRPNGNSVYQAAGNAVDWDEDLRADESEVNAPPAKKTKTATKKNQSTKSKASENRKRDSKDTKARKSKASNQSFAKKKTHTSAGETLASKRPRRAAAVKSKEYVETSDSNSDDLEERQTSLVDEEEENSSAKYSNSLTMMEKVEVLDSQSQDLMQLPPRIVFEATDVYPNDTPQTSSKHTAPRQPPHSASQMISESPVPRSPQRPAPNDFYGVSQDDEPNEELDETSADSNGAEGLESYEELHGIAKDSLPLKNTQRAQALEKSSTTFGSKLKIGLAEANLAPQPTGSKMAKVSLGNAKDFVEAVNVTKLVSPLKHRSCQDQKTPSGNHDSTQPGAQTPGARMAPKIEAQPKKSMTPACVPNGPQMLLRNKNVSGSKASYDPSGMPGGAALKKSRQPEPQSSTAKKVKFQSPNTDQSTIRGQSSRRSPLKKRNQKSPKAAIDAREVRQNRDGVNGNDFREIAFAKEPSSAQMPADDVPSENDESSLLTDEPLNRKMRIVSFSTKGPRNQGTKSPVKTAIKAGESLKISSEIESDRAFEQQHEDETIGIDPILILRATKAEVPTDALKNEAGVTVVQEQHEAKRMDEYKASGKSLRRGTSQCSGRHASQGSKVDENGSPRLHQLPDSYELIMSTSQPQSGASGLFKTSASASEELEHSGYADESSFCPVSVPPTRPADKTVRYSKKARGRQSISPGLMTNEDFPPAFKVINTSDLKTLPKSVLSWGLDCEPLHEPDKAGRQIIHPLMTDLIPEQNESVDSTSSENQAFATSSLHLEDVHRRSDTRVLVPAVRVRRLKPKTPTSTSNENGQKRKTPISFNARVQSMWPPPKPKPVGIVNNNVRKSKKKHLRTVEDVDLTLVEDGNFEGYEHTGIVGQSRHRSSSESSMDTSSSSSVIEASSNRKGKEETQLPHKTLRPTHQALADILGNITNALFLRLQEGEQAISYKVERYGSGGRRMTDSFSTTCSELISHERSNAIPRLAGLRTLYSSAIEQCEDASTRTEEGIRLGKIKGLVDKQQKHILSEIENHMKEQEGSFRENAQ